MKTVVYWGAAIFISVMAFSGAGHWFGLAVVLAFIFGPKVYRLL